MITTVARSSMGITAILAQNDALGRGLCRSKDQAMHIAYVSQPVDGVLPPIQTSIGLWTYHVGRRLARDHQVTVYLKQEWAGGPAVSAGELANYVFVRMLPKRLQPVIDWSGKVLSGPGRPPFAALHYYLEYALQIAADIRRRKVDLVHIHNFTQFVPVIRALNPQVKIVLHMQGEWLTQLDYRMIERRLRQVDRMIGCSDHISNLVRTRYPHLADRCATVHNGFDTSIFSASPAAHLRRPGKRLLFVGRISPEKGVHVLLEAFQKVAASVPEAYLDIVGPFGELPRDFIVSLSDDPHVTRLARFYDGRGYLAHLKDRIPADLAERVVFHGGLPQAEIAAHYRDAAILANPSLSESFGMSIVEAGSFGIPSVVSRVGGMKETVLDGRTGRIVEPSDADGLARSLLELLTDDGRRQEMGQAARERSLECYSWERIARDALTLYSETVKNDSRMIHRAQPDSPHP
jgi:spore coat protein SA